MKQEFNAILETKQQIAAQMIGLEKQISNLAAHPDGRKGMAFAKTDQRALSGDDNDALLGTVLAESFFGAALGELASTMDVPEWATNVEWDNVVEICDEYHTDRANGNNYKMGVNGALTGTFYRRSMNAYNDDLQERQKLEAHYSQMSEKLDYAEKNNGFPPPMFH
jgi:hypothetical protein